MCNARHMDQKWCCNNQYGAPNSSYKPQTANSELQVKIQFQLLLFYCLNSKEPAPCTSPHFSWSPSSSVFSSILLSTTSSKEDELDAVEHIQACQHPRRLSSRSSSALHAIVTIQLECLQAKWSDSSALWSLTAFASAKCSCSTAELPIGKELISSSSQITASVLNFLSATRHLLARSSSNLRARNCSSRYSPKKIEECFNRKLALLLFTIGPANLLPTIKLLAWQTVSASHSYVIPITLHVTISSHRPVGGHIQRSKCLPAKPRLLDAPDSQRGDYYDDS